MHVFGILNGECCWFVIRLQECWLLATKSLRNAKKSVLAEARLAKLAVAGESGYRFSDFRLAGWCFVVRLQRASKR